MRSAIRTLRVNEDVLAFGSHAERAQRYDCGQRQRRSGDRVERGAVPRANDAAAFEFTLVEGSAVVRAHVFDGRDLAVHVAEQNLLAVGLDGLRGSGRDFRDVGDAAKGQFRNS